MMNHCELPTNLFWDLVASCRAHDAMFCQFTLYLLIDNICKLETRFPVSHKACIPWRYILTSKPKSTTESRHQTHLSLHHSGCSLLSVAVPQWMLPVICRCTTVDAACYLSLYHSGCSLLSVAAPQWMLPVICRCTTVDAPCYLSLHHSGCSLLSVAAPQWMLPVICRCTTVDAPCYLSLHHSGCCLQSPVRLNLTCDAQIMTFLVVLCRNFPQIIL